MCEIKWAFLQKGHTYNDLLTLPAQESTTKDRNYATYWLFQMTLWLMGLIIESWRKDWLKNVKNMDRKWKKIGSKWKNWIENEKNG